MACITDADTGNWFSTTMEDIRNKLLIQATSEMIETGIDLCQSHKRFLTSVRDTCSKKKKDDEVLFERVHSYKKYLEEKNALVKERSLSVCHRMSEIERKDSEKSCLIQKMDALRETQAKRKELIVSQNKANKDRLKYLNKAKLVFQERLGLEIRKIHGDKLQFIFRNINHSDPGCTYTFILRLKEDGSYEIVSTDPVLACVSALEQRLQETNNLPAFLANVRKEFAALPKT
uniref:Kinetochore protein SPC25 n=1 Tax=Osmerus mordax TaxID=8014 RepID=C1BKH3_OSMMO|nr:Kinetochore protein Spc25 [Osmerus mordax]